MGLFSWKIYFLNVSVCFSPCDRFLTFSFMIVLSPYFIFINIYLKLINVFIFMISFLNIIAFSFILMFFRSLTCSHIHSLHLSSWTKWIWEELYHRRCNLSLFAISYSRLLFRSLTCSHIHSLHLSSWTQWMWKELHHCRRY